MREQKANDNGFPVVGKQAKEQQIFPFEQLVEYDGATNKITINANLTINGDTNIGELDIDSGDAPKGQVLTADGESGAKWGFPSMEHIVDKDGNPRFVEGNGTIAPPAQIAGLNITYNKWSLSGSHLMVVVAGNVANGTVLANDAFTLYTLPKYIADKIYPVFANTRIEVKVGSFFADNWGKQDATFSLRKLDAPAVGVGINLSSGLTLTADRNFRIQFDLLIDAE